LSVADEVGTRLGKPYKKQLVVGKVAFRNRDIREPFISECEKLGVEVLKFDDIIKEVEAQLGTHSHLNSIIKTIQLSELFLKQ
jgi:hypothetical protein